MATNTLSRSERPPTVTQRSSARYRHWPFCCCSSPETAAGAEEVLALDIEDLDRRMTGADNIAWQARTARLLPRLIGGRTSGPLFVTSRKARVEMPAAHLDE